MKLKSILDQQNQSTLESIADYWHIDLPEASEGKPGGGYRDELVEYLFHRMQSKALFEQAFSQLSPRERELIHFLIIHSGDLSKEELENRFGGIKKNKQDETIKALTLKGFVFYDKINVSNLKVDLVGVPEPFVRHIDLPPFWEGYLGYFLQEMPLRKIRLIAQDGLKIKNPPPIKNALIYMIRSELLNPGKLAEHIQNLSSEEREVVNTIIPKNGFCIYRDLLDTGYQKRYDHARAEHINNLLTRSGLLYIAIPNENKYNSLLMMPKDIFYIITNNYKWDKRDLKDLDTVSAFGEDKTPTVTADNSFNLLRDLVIVVAEISKNKVRRLSTGGVGKNELRKIKPHISGMKGDKYIHFLATFCISKKFLIPVGNVWKVSDRFYEWLEDPYNVYDDLLEWWLKTNEWNEEYIDGNVIHNEEETSRLVNAPELRKKMISSLASLPPHRWIKYAGFADTLLPDIESSLPRRSSSVALDKVGRTNYFTIESTIGECCYWLGIVRVGVDEVKQMEKIGNRGSGMRKATPASRRKKVESRLPLYFRITPMGESVIHSIQAKGDGRISTVKSPELLMQMSEGAEYFVLQPNLEIIAPPDLNLQKLYLLCQMCHIKNVDIMTTLEINRDSIRTALERGFNGSEILTFLQECNRGELPDTLTHLVSEIDKKHGEFDVLLSSAYIKTDDPVIFEALKRNRRFKDYIKDTIDKKAVVLHPGVNLQKAADELKKSGFAPQVESENVQVSKGGRLMLSLTQEEYFNMIAILNLLQQVESEFKEEITDDKAIQLLEKLKSGVQGTTALSTFGMALSKTYYKRFMGAIGNHVDQKTKKYKKQISRLMETVPKTSGKYDFDGPNPAEKKSDIKKMLTFAVKHELPLELRYLNRHEEEIKEVLEPESIDGNKVYGFFKYRDDYSVVKMDAIVQLKLM